MGAIGNLMEVSCKRVMDVEVGEIVEDGGNEGKRVTAHQGKRIDGKG